MASTRPTSRTTALAAMVPKVAICETHCAPYFWRHVVDDAVAPVLAEVDVEVRHRHALGVEEALEEQVVAQRIEVGDAERIGHERAGARAAPRAHRHAVGLGPVDEVGDDEEVAREPHLHDGLHLELEALGVTRPRLVARGRVRVELRQAPVEPLVRLAAQIVLDRHPAGRGKVRQAALAERELEGAAARDLDRILERLGQVGEELRHLGLRLEVLRGLELLRPARISQHVTLRDAHARFVRAVVLRPHELDRVRRDDRQAHAPGERHRGTHIRFALHGVHTLHLDVERAREIRGPGARHRVGRLRPVGGQCGGDVAALGAREDDEPRSAREPLALHFGPPAPGVLHVGARKDVAEGQVAVAIAAKHDDAMGRIAILLVGEPEVAADERLHAFRARGHVELHGAEKVRAVGDRERRHRIGCRGGHRVVHARDAVDDRILRVQA